MTFGGNRLGSGGFAARLHSMRMARKGRRLLGLRFPTQPINNPHFKNWRSYVSRQLRTGEKLLEFGLARIPASGIEGYWAVTNMRSLFAPAFDPEPPAGRVLSTAHRNVLEVSSRRTEDPRIAVVHLMSSATLEDGEVLTAQEEYAVGAKGADNWIRLIQRFRESSAMPEGWQPTVL
jgi:hypothetical protein